ncbi:MAG: hypothetical protein CVT48_06720 [Thermoplasmata archaeon HGW-Thermoplasmata-1]|nr:MAG: hypothetical protein CVT48_06720 [Thermoplasmata archaeon HGW-Thermoplasmata-1]
MPKIRTGIRAAPKSQEKQLVDDAKALSANPLVMVPVCTEGFRKDPFSKLRRAVDVFNGIPAGEAGDRMLSRFAGGKGLVSAIAASVIIAREEKLPYIAVARLPFGDLTYAARGKIQRNFLVAAQHWRDPRARVLGVADKAVKHRLNVYATTERMTCSPNGRPAEEFYDFIAGKLGLGKTDGGYGCGHDGVTSLEIRVASDDKRIRICKHCAKKSVSTVAQILPYVASASQESLLTARVLVHTARCDDPAYETRVNRDAPLDKETMRNYVLGRAHDAEIIEKGEASARGAIIDEGGRLFVLDSVCYGENADAFLDALGPRSAERKGLYAILQKLEEPLLLEGASASKVLELLWGAHGLDALNAVTCNPKLSQSFLGLKDNPSKILEEAGAEAEKAARLSCLPGYDRLPPLAEFADRVARAYTTGGAKDAAREVEKHAAASDVKAAAYGFLLVLGREKERAWQYTGNEREYGEFLASYADSLLRVRGEEYHDALVAFYRAAGGTEEFLPTKKR